ncbi:MULTISPECIES: hypothetical protein [Microbacterium]|uniref:hypothetical protein n=1 Tax=Microbacterium TaxID=33882 RepID=UPI00300DF96F
MDGWRFLRRARNIRMQYVLDLIAMTFGQPLALFPALGTVLLGGGAITTGALTAAVAVGTFLSSLMSGRVVQYRWHGRGIARAVQAYGAAIAVFGAVLLAGVPDAMRGRLQGVFIVVVAGGPRVGALYAGALATVTALWFPPLLGGFVVIVLVAVLARLNPRFAGYDAESPEP